MGQRLPENEKNRALLRLTERIHQCRSGTEDEGEWLHERLRPEGRLAGMVPREVSRRRKIEELNNGYRLPDMKNIEPTIEANKTSVMSGGEFPLCIFYKFMEG